MLAKSSCAGALRRATKQIRGQRLAIAQAEIGGPDAALQNQLGDAVNQRPQPQALGGTDLAIRRTSASCVLQDRVGALTRTIQGGPGRGVLSDGAKHEAAQRGI